MVHFRQFSDIDVDVDVDMIRSTGTNRGNQIDKMIDNYYSSSLVRFVINGWDGR